MITVGEIRNAIRRLPDEANVGLWIHQTEESRGFAFIELKGAVDDDEAFGGPMLGLVLSVTVCGEIEDDDQEANHGT